MSLPVLLSRRAGVQHALEQLAKRAARKGLPALTWEWGKPSATRERVPHPEYGWEAECYGTVARIPLTFTSEMPKFAGWTFVAALEHLDGENIVRTLAGEELPPAFRTRGPVCDHCRANRRRADTYVVRHEDGRVLQVGSTCIRDFLGSDEALKLAEQASMLAAAFGLASDDLGGFGGGSPDCMLSSYLPFVAWTVRVEGWVSRTAARESPNGSRATADVADQYMSDKKAREKANANPTAEDDEVATATEKWAEALTDEQINAEKGDYLHNLRVIARSGVVNRKSMGLAASMIIAYQRFLGRERQRAERAARPRVETYVGVVGERSTWQVTLDFVTGYESAYGYVTVYKFLTPEGACLVWKSTGDVAVDRSDVGKTYWLTGTVKKHDEYKGHKQTIVSRCNASTEPPAPKTKRAKKPKTAEPPPPVCPHCGDARPKRVWYLDLQCTACGGIFPRPITIARTCHMKGHPMLLVAKLPDGTRVTRQTHHSYTHVIAVRNKAGEWYAWGWTGKNGPPHKPIKPKPGWAETRLVPVEP